MTKLIEVAARAGLSPATVSRYLNGTLKLPAATIARIEEAVAALDYKPNFIARSLRGYTDNVVGIFVPNLQNPYCATILTSLSAEAATRGLRALTLIANGDPQAENEAITLLKRRNLSGLLVLSNNDTDVSTSAPSGLPIVTVVEPIKIFAQHPAIIMDDVSSGIAVADHFFAQGHRDTAVISGRQTLLSSSRRTEAFVARMIELGAPKPEVIYGEYSLSFGYETALELLSRAHPTAIFAAADIIAIGCYRAAQKLGLSIPQDLSIVGYDDLPYVDLFSPPLTTLKQDFNLIATHALDLLQARMRGEKLDHTASILLTPELILRGSSAPPSR